VPDEFAPVALPSARMSARALEHRLPDGSMAATVDGMTVALVPDLDGPGRALELDRALGGAPAARGAAIGWQDAAEAISRAVLAAELQEAGVLASDDMVCADDHLVELIVHRDPERARALADSALEPLDGLSPSSRERLTETLEGWLSNACNTTDTARALHLHPQTLRYRLRQLGEVLGDDRMADADARLALQIALKVRRSSGSGRRGS
jgi:DNA-binding PucR family transcriptional regulator